MLKEVRLNQLSFNSLIRDLSYDEFFDRYDPWKDGKVFVNTYSFHHENFDFWSRLKPGSVFNISSKYANLARQFIKRFPWFEVNVVSKQHSKVIFFEDSGVLLIGSENLYTSQSDFFEVMIETVVAQKQREEVVKFLFAAIENEPLRCVYDKKDIKIYKEGIYPEGILCLPSNLEIHYWELIANIYNPRWEPEKNRVSFPGVLYAIFEYNIQEKKHYLGINRGYHYCGDLSTSLFDWILENTEIEETLLNYHGGFFPDYHPIPKNRIASKVYFLGKVRNHIKFENLKINAPREDISKKLIPKKSSWQSYFDQ